jgi:A118 family predicted phage portal protein
VPLPDRNMAWPPPKLKPAFEAMNTWDAWYGGDPERLTALYGGGASGPQPRPVQYGTGVVSRIARWWWGTPPAPGEQRTKLHIPIAGDLCGASSDLLFSEAPVLRAKDDTTQKRLDLIADEGMHASLQTAAEVAAALGGVYLRPVYDPNIRDRPWLDAVHADRAVPEFTWGQLSAVTFWHVLSDDGKGTVYRHLERHDPEQVSHGLYKGDDDTLGMLVPLEEHPATARYTKLVNDQGIIPSPYKGLAPAYIPNVNSRRWRGVQALTHFGRSDLESIEPLMDALDEAYASWMRDVRLGKGRVIAPNAFLQNLGPGQGALYNPDQEIYSGLEILPKSGDSALEVVQFEIRVAQHRDTVNDLIDQILRSAGYSGQTFGRGQDVAVTATEVTARERRSMTTRGKKILRWQAGLGHALEALLAVDAEVFRSGVIVQQPVIEFGDSVSEDPLTLANTLQFLSVAEAASTEWKVRRLNPDYDDKLVQAEVARIHAEKGVGVASPDHLGGDGGGFPGAGGGPGDTGQ